MTHPPLLGVLLALIFYAVSASPSLLPRRWWWHGFVSGPLMALGYSIGWALTNALRAGSEYLRVTVEGPRQLFQTLEWVAVVGVLVWTVWASARAYSASKRAAVAVGIKPVGPGEYLLALIATTAMFIATMALVYLLTEIFTLLTAILDRWLPFAVAWVVAVAVAVLVVLVVSNKVVFKLFMAYFAKAAQGINDRSNPDLQVPTVPQRSGSPQSTCSWESIGGQGRLFLGHGPNADQIAAVTGRPALEPVRVYVGMPPDQRDPRKLAAKAVEELRRAGGLERAIIVVNTATGSGWVDEWLCQPVEYMTGGNCAIVSMQYSYLFSAALMVSDLTPCAEAGAALFEAVEHAVNGLPEGTRPLILVAGESLGAYGSQAAFADLEDFNSRADGAIWVGSPYESRLLRQLTEGRHHGSPEVAPVYDNGRHARFATHPDQLETDLYGRELGAWHFPRSVFVQHGSDPVARYTTKLAFREPDWLSERVGPDVSPSMRYTPIATYLQVIADLPVAGLAPSGHGHTYHRELLDSWVKVLALDQELALGRIPAGDWIDNEMKERIADAIEEDLRRYHKGMGAPKEDL